MRSDRAARANAGGSGVGAAWFPIDCATRPARRLESRGNELGWRRPPVAFHPPRWSVRACQPGRVRGGVLAGVDPSATGLAFSPACGAALAQQPGALRRKNDPVTASHDDVECLQASRRLRMAPAIGEAELPADLATQPPRLANSSAPGMSAMRRIEAASLRACRICDVGNMRRIPCAASWSAP